MIILKYSRYTMETMIRWSNTKNTAMNKIAAMRNFVFNMTECDGVASSTTAVSSAGSPCQSKCFELRLVTLCHSPHPLLSPDIQVPGLSVVCPNGIFYMYQLNWHVSMCRSVCQYYVIHNFYSFYSHFFSLSFYILLSSFVMWTILLFYIGVYFSGMNCTTRSSLQHL